MDVGSVKKNINIESAVFYSLLLLIVWVPLPYGSNRAWAWSLMEVWIFILLLVWCFTWIRGSAVVPDSFKSALPALYILLAWDAYILLQMIPLPLAFIEAISPERVASQKDVKDTLGFLSISQDTGSTLSFFIKSVAYTVFFSLCVLLVNTKKKIQVLAYVVIYSALFQAVYGSLMTLSGAEYGFLSKKIYGIGNATGTFINRNHFAGYLEISLAIGTGVMISNLSGRKLGYGTRQKIRNLIVLMFSKKLRLRTYLSIMVIALVLTHSRMGNTAFFVSLTVSGASLFLLAKEKRKSLAVFIISVIAIDIFIVGAWFGLEKVTDRIENTTITKEQRLDVDRYALDYITNYPLVGSGAGTFFAIFPKYRGSDVKKYFDHAHNDYIELISEVGVFGVVMLFSIVAMSIYKSVLSMYQRRDSLVVGMAFAVFMGVLSIMIHSFVDFNLQIPANALLFILLLSLSYVTSSIPIGGAESKG